MNQHNGERGRQRGKVVVVTGASAGIGRATLRAFAARGASLGLIARGMDGLIGARREVERAGGRAIAISADVADAQQVLDAAQRIEDDLGPIDIWVNNAMTSVFAPFWDVEAHEFERVTQVTYHGYVNGTRAALKHMRPRDAGLIVQVGSAVAYRSIPLQSAYSGAKAAIRGFTDSLRVELAHEKSNVRLTAVHLPAHNTPQFRWSRSHLPREAQPIPPIYQPEVAAEAIVWVTENYRREIHLAYPSFLAILGEKVAPGFMDRYLIGSWEGQMTGEPRDQSAADNLYEALPGDAGAHGVFDDRARGDAPFWRIERNRGAITAGVAGAASVGLIGMLLGRRRARS